MVLGDTHSGLIVALQHTLFPPGVVPTEPQGRLALTVPIDSGIHGIVESIFDRMICRQVPPQLHGALDRLMHRKRHARLMEPLKHLAHTLEFAQLPKH
jgi:hypothetical protein